MFAAIRSIGSLRHRADRALHSLIEKVNNDKNVVSRGVHAIVNRRTRESASIHGGGASARDLERGERVRTMTTDKKTGRYARMKTLHLSSTRNSAGGCLRHVASLAGALAVLALLMLTLAVDTKVKLSARCQLASLQLRVYGACLLYTSPSPRDATLSRMPSSA